MSARKAEQPKPTTSYEPTIERGLRAPTLEMVFRLSTALQVAPAFIVERTALELRRSGAGGAS
jgi:transcriptional regulator with XRE-family HTH domain